jgi:Ca2+-transporting ATPase
VNRSWTRSLASTLRVPNPALWAVCGGTLFFLALVLFTPGLRGLFHFTPTAPARYLICVAASVLSLAWFEGLKRVWRWKKAG